VVRARFKKTGRSSRLPDDPSAIDKNIDLGGFRTPLYPLIPILFIIIIGWFISQNVIAEKKEVYAGLLVLPVGVIFYYLFRHFNRTKM
jgi:hypothetical protein